MKNHDGKEKRALAVYISIFLLLVMGITTSGYVSYRNFEREFRRQVEHQISAIAELKVNGLVSWRKERLGDADILYQAPAFSALVERYFENSEDVEARTQLLDWLGNYQVYDQYDRVRLLDVTGAERLSSPTTPDAVDTRLVIDVATSLHSGRIIFGDFYRDTSADGEIHISIFVPIFTEQNDNRPLGVLVLSINPQTYLYPYIQSWPINSTSAETLLVRRDGGNVLFLNELRFGQDAVLTLRLPLTDTDIPAVKAVLGQTGVEEGLDYRGEPVLADVRPVPDSPWFLVSKMDIAEVYAPLRTRLWQTVLIIGMAIFVAGAGLVTVWRQQRILFYRTQAEAAGALRESEEMFRVAFDNAPTGMSLIGPDGITYLAVNPLLCEMFGYAREEFLGQTIHLVTHPDDEERSNEWIRKGYNDEPCEPEIEKRYIHKDGHIVWGLVRAQWIKNEDGSHRMAIAHILDVTARKQAEEEIRQLNLLLEQRVRERTAQLETTNKELEAFSYSVSHDLRAPLRGIDGWSQALLEDYYDQLDKQGQQYIDRVRSETQRMGHLIDDMLQLSRLTRAEMIKEQVDLSALAQAIAERLKQDELHRQVDFNIQTGLTAEGDLHLLEAVLANLLGNAFKFTAKRADARIEFGQTELQGQHAFFVRDNGAGFDMAYHQKIFGAFQRLHKASEFPGTGIGLATVQRIIHRHGGRVWAEAEVERGATFYFTLG